MSAQRLLDPQAVKQQALLDVLAEQPGVVIPMTTIITRLYGEYSVTTHNAFRVDLCRLRKSLPSLEIERVNGYRLRRPLPC
jgi:DNA-binding response OmpR family regulator